MGAKFFQARSQKQSPFFRKLPQEIRRMIYIQLFGDFVVHIRWLKEKNKFRRDHAPKGQTGWFHCICRRPYTDWFHCHNEDDHKWCYLSTNLIFTCKRIFEEGIEVLYSTNALMFENAADLAATFRRLETGFYVERIRSISVMINGSRINHTQTWSLDLMSVFQTFLTHRTRDVDLEIMIDEVIVKKEPRLESYVLNKNALLPAITYMLDRIMTQTSISVTLYMPCVLKRVFATKVRQSWTRFDLKDLIEVDELDNYFASDSENVEMVHCPS